MLEIAIIGPECSGKTSLTKALAAHFQVNWFKEYAREYLENKRGDYQERDLLIMARRQEEIRTTHHSNASILFYDTENITFKIWSEVKFKQVDPEIEKRIINQHFDCYFLCSPDGIPWEDDPLRESPNSRSILFKRYLHELEERKLPFAVFYKSPDQRLTKAIELTRELQQSLDVNQ